MQLSLIAFELTFRTQKNTTSVPAIASRMIHSIRDLNERFQLLHRCNMKALERRRQRKEAVANRIIRRQRAKSDVQRDKHPNYWQSTWGQLVIRLAAIEGGPSIFSRDGKLFRRRFRVPY